MGAGVEKGAGPQGARKKEERKEKLGYVPTLLTGDFGWDG